MSPPEYEDLKAGEPLDHRLHSHVSRVEATKIIEQLWVPNKDVSEQAAVRIDARHIVVRQARKWQRAWSGDYRVWQLLPVGEKTKSPFFVR